MTDLVYIIKANIGHLCVLNGKTVIKSLHSEHLEENSNWTETSCCKNDSRVSNAPNT